MPSKRLQPKIMGSKEGQSLLELILAMMVLGGIAAALISMAVGSFRGLEQGGEQTEAEALAQEGIDAVRSIRDRAWNENTFANAETQRVLPSGGQWIFNGTGSDTTGKFTRTITFNDICRDNTSQDIADCGTCGVTCYTDPHTKKVTVTVTWTTRGGVSNTVQKVAYISNWDSKEWIQDTTAQISCGNPGVTCTSVEISPTAGDANGAITLQQQ